jgi:hypothetical protein
MGGKSFTLNPNFCLIKFGKANSECVFDSWSIHHFYWHGFLYIILHHLFNIKLMNKALVLTAFITLLHIIEEYFGNIGMLSFEGIFVDNIGPIVNPKIDIKLREPDNDYLDNSIGDVLSGFTSNILILLYWYHYKKLPYSYLLLSIFVLYLLYKKSYFLYPKKK